MFIIERLPCRPSECFHFHPLAVYDAPLVPFFPLFFEPKRPHYRHGTHEMDEDQILFVIAKNRTCKISSLNFRVFSVFRLRRGSPATLFR